MFLTLFYAVNLFNFSMNCLSQTETTFLMLNTKTCKYARIELANLFNYSKIP